MLTPYFYHLFDSDKIEKFHAKDDKEAILRTSQIPNVCRMWKVEGTQKVLYHAQKKAPTTP